MIVHDRQVDQGGWRPALVLGDDAAGGGIGNVLTPSTVLDDHADLVECVNVLPDRDHGRSGDPGQLTQADADLTGGGGGPHGLGAAGAVLVVDGLTDRHERAAGRGGVDGTEHLVRHVRHLEEPPARWRRAGRPDGRKDGRDGLGNGGNHA